MTNLILKGDHQMISGANGFETNVIVIFFQDFAVVVNFLPNRKVPHSERSVTWTAPNPHTGGKVSLLRKEVCAEDPIVGLSKASASLV
jgi:hypothetical protein